jgi:hypothetical protein
VEPLRLLALSTNVRLGWRGFSGTNVLDLQRTSTDYGREKFYDTGRCETLFIFFVSFVVDLVIHQSTCCHRH